MGDETAAAAASGEHRSLADLQAITVGEPERIASQIALSEYDPEWPRQFEAEAARVRSVLGDQVVILEHVGSTSVPGLAAKPKIDMLLVLPQTADESTYVPQMEAAGYVLRIREPEWYEHRLFKGPDLDINLHVLPEGCQEIDRMIGFRDWLRTHDDDRQLYEQTKRDLSSRTWEYMQHYADAKNAVVDEIATRAQLPPRLD